MKLFDTVWPYIPNIYKYVKRSQDKIYCPDFVGVKKHWLGFVFFGSYYKQGCIIIQANCFTNLHSSLIINPNSRHSITSETGMSLAGHMPIPACKAARFYFLCFKNVHPMLHINIHYGVNVTVPYKTSQIERAKPVTEI